MPAVKEQTQEVTDTSVIVFCLTGLFFWRSLQVMLGPLSSKEQLFVEEYIYIYIYIYIYLFIYLFIPTLFQWI